MGEAVTGAIRCADFLNIFISIRVNAYCTVDTGCMYDPLVLRHSQGEITRSLKILKMAAMSALQFCSGAVLSTVFHPVGYAKVLIQVDKQRLTRYICCSHIATGKR